jgi:heme/copper-type cytochrome/quinol oxidase subunit 3
MEIPYEVKPRPDTGLWNAKIGIWLFLASEVMLFGGLFSGYVFLRLGSGADPDYHWPHGLLDVRLGFINTLVLIASSVFIVMAWVQLKLRSWKGFKMWMTLVLICAGAFLVIKSFEYNAKFHHYGVKLSDKTIIEGHELTDDVRYDDITQVTIPLSMTDLRLNSVIVGEGRGDIQFRVKPDQDGVAGLISAEKVDAATFFETSFDGKFAGKGYQLSDAEKSAIEGAYKDLEDNLKGSFELTDAKLRQIKSAVDAHRAAQLPPLERARQKEYDALRTEIKDGLEVTLEVDGLRILLSKPIKWLPARGIEAVTFEPTLGDSDQVQAFSIETRRSKLRSFKEDGGTLWDQTAFIGKLSAEKRFLTLQVDNIDLRSTQVPEDSIIWDYADHHAKDEFFAHRKEVEDMAKDKGKQPSIDKSLRNHQHKDEHGHYPEIRIPLDQVTLYSNFTPKWNTYLAVYFTLTGLHGLHVLIGALVLAYFLFFGKKMFDSDPEHLANRVEVGGLFWHFVDLVWIFLFPILYLM